MSEGDPPSSLQKLDAQLRQARAREAGREAEAGRGGHSGSASPSGLGVALRIGSELAAGVAVGVGIGWVLDRAFDTKPWLMVVFFLLGSAAGMLNVYRALQRMAPKDGPGAHR